MLTRCIGNVLPRGASCLSRPAPCYARVFTECHSFSAHTTRLGLLSDRGDPSQGCNWKTVSTRATANSDEGTQAPSAVPAPFTLLPPLLTTSAAHVLELLDPGPEGQLATDVSGLLAKRNFAHERLLSHLMLLRAKDLISPQQLHAAYHLDPQTERNMRGALNRASASAAASRTPPVSATATAAAAAAAAGTTGLPGAPPTAAPAKRKRKSRSKAAVAAAAAAAAAGLSAAPPTGATQATSTPPGPSAAAPPPAPKPTAKRVSLPEAALAELQAAAPRPVSQEWREATMRQVQLLLTEAQWDTLGASAMLLRQLGGADRARLTAYGAGLPLDQVAHAAAGKRRDQPVSQKLVMETLIQGLCAGWPLDLQRLESDYFPGGPSSLGWQDIQGALDGVLSEGADMAGGAALGTYDLVRMRLMDDPATAAAVEAQEATHGGEGFTTQQLRLGKYWLQRWVQSAR